MGGWGNMLREACWWGEHQFPPSHSCHDGFTAGVLSAVAAAGKPWEGKWYGGYSPSWSEEEHPDSVHCMIPEPCRDVGGWNKWKRLILSWILSFHLWETEAENYEMHWVRKSLMGGISLSFVVNFHLQVKKVMCCFSVPPCLCGRLPCFFLIAPFLHKRSPAAVKTFLCAHLDQYQGWTCLRACGNLLLWSNIACRKLEAYSAHTLQMEMSVRYETTYVQQWESGLSYMEEGVHVI